MKINSVDIMEKPKNCVLVIFGASGDLTRRKLIPALFELKNQNLLPDNFTILGAGRTKLDDLQFRDKMKGSLTGISDEKLIDNKMNNTKNNTIDNTVGNNITDEFLQDLFYIPIDTKSENDYALLKKRLEMLNSERNGGSNYLFYFATPPDLYGAIAANIGVVGLNSQAQGYSRLIIEKPFGYDFESAIELNKNLYDVFAEEQIYRIDHYLGKETVQNLLVTRFANGIFEPLWNRNYVHHVEITSAESIGVENRGGYYDSSGALRDMVQNHLLQLVGLTAMEPPSSFDSNSIRNETLKVFQALKQIPENEVDKFVIRGQYTASKIKGESIAGYREEKGVSSDSRTETYVAVKFFIDNWRWGSVPFYIRTGKRLPTRVTEIVIHFKPTPHNLFSKEREGIPGNQLVMRIQPDEGILLKFGMKIPGTGFNVKPVNMDFHYSDLSNVHVPSSYERLLYDAMIGDSTLYTRGDSVEAAWKFVAPIQKAWKNNPSIKVYGYPGGTWGPEDADSLIEGVDMAWRYPCKNLSDDGEYCEL
jgi:glucose-6-phosphate 1-dehydrogenase